ncbi:MAG: cobalamin-dependent protein, partial [Myxococcota bacterium]|nr:cobalamin-dependent protein [Myxococcota bacterium]
MRIVFLQDTAVNESLALTELSAVLQRGGHTTRLYLGDEEPELDTLLRDYDPDLAIIPCHVAGHLVALGFADRVKRVKPGCVVALGGTHVTFDPGLARHPSVDVTCVGECEGAFLDLADALQRG